MTRLITSTLITSFLVIGSHAYTSFVQQNILSLEPTRQAYVTNKIRDLVSMYRTYFEDNLDNCSDCIINWPSTGKQGANINKVDDDVYNIMANCAKNRYPLDSKDYEFLMQINLKLSFKVPVASPEIKHDSMRLIEMVYKDTIRDLRQADKIYKKMQAFDRTNDYRKNLIDWIIAGMDSHNYGNLRDDILANGVEVMHIFMRKKEFQNEETCEQFLTHLDFLIDQSTIWIWQARGLIFSSRIKPIDRQKILMEGLASTLIEISWYLQDTSVLPDLIHKNCNGGSSFREYEIDDGQAVYNGGGNSRGGGRNY